MFEVDGLLVGRMIVSPAISKYLKKLIDILLQWKGCNAN